MPKLNREYKKGGAHRDARLFVIVAEGDREDEYFTHFNSLSQRIRILPIPREEGASAPKHFISRLQTAIKNGDYDPDDSDQIWFVCDTDRWKGQLGELITDCKRHPNWQAAISNPCFEVWLHYHSGPVNAEKVSCSHLKTTLAQSSLGSFSPKEYCAAIEDAICHAEKADLTPNNEMPIMMQTKLYRLAKEMRQFI